MKEILEGILLYFTCSASLIMPIIIGNKMADMTWEKTEYPASNNYIMIQRSNRIDLSAAIIVLVMAASGTLALL